MALRARRYSLAIRTTGPRGQEAKEYSILAQYPSTHRFILNATYTSQQALDLASLVSR